MWPPAPDVVHGRGNSICHRYGQYTRVSQTYARVPACLPSRPACSALTLLLYAMNHWLYLWLAQVISGLNKFDADLVAKVAKATAAGGGTHIDIACDPDLVRAAKAVSNVPVSVLS